MNRREAACKVRADWQAARPGHLLRSVIVARFATLGAAQAVVACITSMTVGAHFFSVCRRARIPGKKKPSAGFEPAADALETHTSSAEVPRRGRDIFLTYAFLFFTRP